eukprot:230715-Amphidinium_carterae.1
MSTCSLWIFTEGRRANEACKALHMSDCARRTELAAKPALLCWHCRLSLQRLVGIQLQVHDRGGSHSVVLKRCKLVAQSLRSVGLQHASHRGRVTCTGEHCGQSMGTAATLLQNGSKLSMWPYQKNLQQLGLRTQTGHQTKTSAYTT